MRRDPSLHITKSTLVDILNQLDYGSRTTGQQLASMIFDAAQPYQIRDRYLEVIQAKGKTRDKIIKSQTVDSEIGMDEVEKFHKLLISQRMKSEFSKPKPIMQTDRDYLLLKEIALNAHRFARHFEFKLIDEGLLEYIKLGLRFMGKKYGLNKFKTYENRIYDYFEAYVFVLLDEDKAGTSEFYQIWKDRMLSYDNMQESSVSIESDYIKYSSMVYGRMEADEAGAYYEDWITAQFEQLKFLNVIPELGGFHGENARNRYQRYMNDSIVEEEPNDILRMYGQDSDK